jgi:hypothetical protein
MRPSFAIALALLPVHFTCPGAGRADFNYSGLATGAFATVEVTFLIGTTGPLPSEGGIREVYLPSSSFGSLLATGPISGLTLGTNGLATADITVNDLLLTYGGNTISAQMVGGHATADGHTGGLPEVGGFSDFRGLTINGEPITVTGAPNQQIDLSNNMKLVLNEQRVDDTDGTIMLNALHLYGNPVVDFRIASAQAGITVNPSDSPAAPEPGTLALLGVALIGLLAFRWVVRQTQGAGGGMYGLSGGDCQSWGTSRSGR